MVTCYLMKEQLDRFQVLRLQDLRHHEVAPKVKDFNLCKCTFEFQITRFLDLINLDTKSYDFF